MAKERSKSTTSPVPTRAGVWAIIQCADTGKILLGKRAPQVNNGGAWNFFGGRIDQGESPRNALARELAEEAGLRVKRRALIKLGRVASQRGPLDRQMHYYLLRVDQELAPRLNAEHSGYRWFAPTELPGVFNRPTRLAIRHGLLQRATRTRM
jgi:8-oxo-dGTP diphosphatase